MLLNVNVRYRSLYGVTGCQAWKTQSVEMQLQRTDGLGYVTTDSQLEMLRLKHWNHRNDS